MVNECVWLRLVHEVTSIDCDHPTVRKEAHQVGDLLLRDRTSWPAGQHQGGSCDRRDHVGPLGVEVVDLWAHLRDHSPVEWQHSRGPGRSRSRTGLEQPDVLEYDPAHQLGTGGSNLAGHQAAQGMADQIDGLPTKPASSRPVTSSASNWIE